MKLFSVGYSASLLCDDRRRGDRQAQGGGQTNVLPHPKGKLRLRCRLSTIYPFDTVP